MKKLVLLFAITFISVGFISCSDTTDDSDLPIVAVSIVPQAAFVDAIAGDLVETITIIPPGSSPATYEPTAQTMASVSDASVYFTIGVPTEEGNILPEVDDLYVVNLEDIVAEVYDDLTLTSGGRDPHIWLSIKRVKVMVETIADELALIDPDNAETYQENATEYLALLDETNETIEGIFSDVTMDTFIVYHPAFGYFSDEYDLDMVVLQEDGQEASVAHLQEVIDLANELSLEYVFYQSEIDSSQVASFADEINATMVELEPLSSDYVNNLLTIANLIREALR